MSRDSPPRLTRVDPHDRQVGTAQIVRRLRELDLPLPEIKAVLAAPDTAGGDRTNAEHLRRMERQLDHTRAVVSSLRELLCGTGVVGQIRHRHLPAVHVAAIRGTTDRAGIGTSCGQAFDELFQILGVAGAVPAPRSPRTCPMATALSTRSI